jgi:hypothetical protein
MLEALEQASAAATPARGYMPASSRDDQCTPPEIVEVVRWIFGGTIDLDPCSNPWSVVGAEREVMLPEWEGAELSPERHARVTYGDGLAIPWKGRKYLNPPYGAEPLTAFMNNARHAAALGEGPSIMLTKVKSSLRGWQVHVPPAASTCWLKGRVSYLVPGEEKRVNAPFCSALILWADPIDRELLHRFNYALDGRLGYCSRRA